MNDGFGALSTALIKSITQNRPDLQGPVDELRAHVRECSNPGDVIMLSVPTSWAYIACMAAVIAEERVGTSVGPSATAHEIEVAQVTRPRLVIHLASDSRFPGKRDDWRVALDALELTTTIVGSDPPLLADSDLWLAATSGSTGSPKYAILTAGALLSNARATVDMQELTAAAVVCMFTPSNFSYALNQVISASIACARLRPWSHGLASPASLQQFILNERVTHFSANPTSLRMLLSTRAERTNPYVQGVVSGGQPLNRHLVTRIRDAYPAANIYSAYGCTENVNRVSFFVIRPDTPIDFAWAPVGSAAEGTQISLAEVSGVSEVTISGSSLMRGYLGEVAIDEAVSEFRTGDIGEIGEDGGLRITGRIKTAMNVGNEMVRPEEVEQVGLTAVGVAECAVGPIKDELLGECAAALVVVESDVDQDAIVVRLRTLWKNELSHAKRPRKVAIVSDSEIPRTAYGKIDRQALRSALKSKFEVDDGLQ